MMEDQELMGRIRLPCPSCKHQNIPSRPNNRDVVWCRIHQLPCGIIQARLNLGDCPWLPEEALGPYIAAKRMGPASMDSCVDYEKRPGQMTLGGF